MFAQVLCMACLQLHAGKKNGKVYANGHGLWEALDRPMASCPLKGM